MKEIALATILHDPENRQFNVAKNHLGLLSQYYSNVYIARSEKVDPNFVSILEENNCKVEIVHEKVGGSRRACVEAALKDGNELIHYCDFDRIIHWLRTYPDELTLIPALLSSVDYLITERTERAFQTHPEVQQYMEGMTNSAFGIYFGQEVDVTAGSSAMNTQAAKTILENSTSENNETDTEWPKIIYASGQQIGVKKFEGLEFETADYYDDQITNLEAWKAELSLDVNQWKNRAKLALGSINLLQKNEN